ncbi:MAG: hypothetical protein WBN24_05335 [Acidimicrobiia bacterium]
MRRISLLTLIVIVGASACVGTSDGADPDSTTSTGLPSVSTTSTTSDDSARVGRAFDTWTLNGEPTAEAKAAPWLCDGPPFIIFDESVFGIRAVFLRADETHPSFFPASSGFETAAAATFRADVELPSDATFSGFATDAVEIWLVNGDLTGLYVVFLGTSGSEHVEFWPAVPVPGFCE